MRERKRTIGLNDWGSVILWGVAGTSLSVVFIALGSFWCEAPVNCAFGVAGGVVIFGFTVVLLIRRSLKLMFGMKLGRPSSTLKTFYSSIANQPERAFECLTDEAKATFETYTAFRRHWRDVQSRIGPIGFHSQTVEPEQTPTLARGRAVLSLEDDRYTWQDRSLQLIGKDWLITDGTFTDF